MLFPLTNFVHIIKIYTSPLVMSLLLIAILELWWKTIVLCSNTSHLADLNSFSCSNFQISYIDLVEVVDFSLRIYFYIHWKFIFSDIFAIFFQQKLATRLICSSNDSLKAIYMEVVTYGSEPNPSMEHIKFHEFRLRINDDLTISWIRCTPAQVWPPAAVPDHTPIGFQEILPGIT